MAKKNPLIEELRELGVTDYQRKKLRQLEREFQESGAYKQIEETNLELMGERIRPVSLSYDTAVRLLKYNIYGNIDSIIKEYQTAIMYVNQGTTKEYEDYINKMAEELQEIGIYNATPEKLKDADTKTVEFWYSEYKKYENTGNSGGMHHAREKIISTLEK